LRSAANLSILNKKNKNVKKYWWDQELNKLKEKSIATHKTWINQGRPRQGNVLFEK